VKSTKNAPLTVDREAWLNKAVDLIRPLFEDYGYAVPPCRVSVGFPSRSALSPKSKRLGECWDKIASSEGVAQVFITPLISNPIKDDNSFGVLDILVHELVHVVVGNEAGHGAKFGACARKVGLEGKMTSTVPGKALVGRLETMLKALGPYPHASLNPVLSGKKKQGTRMIKCECKDCGYTVRTTKKWLEDVGAPLCPKHRTSMEFELPDEDSDDSEESDD
jgi:hypothetical protein